MDPIALKQTALRVSNARASVLKRQPFFGRLLMHLNLSFADCKTAYTDMKRIVFDPSFAIRLNDEALEFVLIHELLHCVLKHCTRGSGRFQTVYNIACDIVVNSILLEAWGKKDFEIDGEAVMHLTPDKKEGRNYSADEIYDQLMKLTPAQLNSIYASDSIDNHDEWSKIFSDSVLEEIWNKQIIDTAKSAGVGSGIPEGLQRVLTDISHSVKIDWKQILRDLLQFDRADYTFSPPDKRFTDDFFLPSFQENIYGDRADKLWFAVDTSGSISDVALAEALFEIKDASLQIEHLSGSISFFDCKVSEPIPFEKVSDLDDIKPVGGGGTSFKAVFKFMAERFKDDLPSAIIIMTDGYDRFPNEKAALGVKVIWLIVNSTVEPPWGNTVHINT